MFYSDSCRLITINRDDSTFLDERKCLFVSNPNDEISNMEKYEENMQKHN